MNCAAGSTGVKRCQQIRRSSRGSLLQRYSTVAEPPPNLAVNVLRLWRFRPAQMKEANKVRTPGSPSWRSTHYDDVPAFTQYTIRPKLTSDALSNVILSRLLHDEGHHSTPDCKLAGGDGPLAESDDRYRRTQLRKDLGSTPRSGKRCNRACAYLSGQGGRGVRNGMRLSSPSLYNRMIWCGRNSGLLVRTGQSLRCTAINFRETAFSSPRRTCGDRKRSWPM